MDILKYNFKENNKTITHIYIPINIKEKFKKENFRPEKHKQEEDMMLNIKK